MNAPTLLSYFDLNEQTILAFMAVLTRVSFIVIFLPFWGEMMTPPLVRIYLSLALAMLLTPVAPMAWAAYPSTLGALALAVGVEAAFGFSVAFVVRLLFTAVQVGGQVAGHEMGFAMANILAPDQSAQITVVAQFKYVFSILLFFAFGLHLVFFNAIAATFETVPVFQGRPSLGIVELVDVLTRSMFSTAIQIAAPFLATMILVNAAMALINKATPQVHVFLESFPVRILLGLFMFSMITYAMARVIQHHFSYIGRIVEEMALRWV